MTDVDLRRPGGFRMRGAAILAALAVAAGLVIAGPVVAPADAAEGDTFGSVSGVVFSGSSGTDALAARTCAGESPNRVSYRLAGSAAPSGDFLARSLEDSPEFVLSPDATLSTTVVLLPSAVISGHITTTARIVIPDDRVSQEKYRRLVAASLRHDGRPKGQRLSIRNRGPWGAGPTEVFFSDYLDDLVSAEPVSVPTSVTNFHEAVKAFVADRDWQWVTKPHVKRASLIVEALVREGERRSFKILTRSQADDRLQPQQVVSRRRRHLAMITPAGIYAVQIREVPGPNEVRL